MASLPFHLVLFVGLFLGLICIADVGEGFRVTTFGDGLSGNQREFDYFMLSLLWPGTACRHTRHCCPSNGCCHGSNSLQEFTIHGLWSDYNDGTWPACCSGPSFDPKEISTLGDALQRYWPSLSCSSPSTCHGGKGSFWAHEWEKHGTCSAPVTGNEYSYFLTTINVFFKHNVTQVLNEAGYVPSNSEKYPVGGIISAIQNAFHATPEIQCKGDAIEEVHLCFFKDFKPRDCHVEPHIQSYLVGSSSCPKYVSLPVVERVNQDSPTPTRHWRSKESVWK